MNKSGLVSIIIPTINSSTFLNKCLKSIREQSYKDIEVIVVDGGSTDSTLKIADKYGSVIFNFSPTIASGLFDAPHKRNYGVKRAKGEYVYYLDADMQLQKKVVKEAVEKCKAGYDAVIIPEISVGKGIWARAKNLERLCYHGDDTVEAPRFIRRKVWKEIGGLDESVGGGGDDWDLYQKLLEKGFIVARTKSLAIHNEGDLTLGKLIKKRFMYGREAIRYIQKRPREGFKSFFPIRKSYLRNWHLFLQRPTDSLFFTIMRTTEYTAGILGVLYSLIYSRQKNDD